MYYILPNPVPETLLPHIQPNPRIVKTYVLAKRLHTAAPYLFEQYPNATESDVRKALIKMRADHPADFNILHALNLIRDHEFCARLLDMFLVDNRMDPTPYTPTDNQALLAAFETPAQLLQFGDVLTVRYLLSLIDPEQVVKFTQARKDKYLAALDDYIATRYTP